VAGGRKNLNDQSEWTWRPRKPNKQNEESASTSVYSCNAASSYAGESANRLASAEIACPRLVRVV
jgi:hypothetical protein